MTGVTVFMALMTSFVLAAPIAMATLLLRGPAPLRRTVELAAVAACSCVRDCTCAPRIRSAA